MAREVSSWGVIALALALALAAAGWLWLGLVGGIAGLFLGALAGTLVAAIGRYSSARDALSERNAPDVRALAPDKALAVLAAAAGSETAGSEVLTTLDAVRNQAQTDLGGAFAMLRVLADKYPRSPAVAAEFARMHSAVDRRSEAREQLQRALTLALDGGMNPAAATLFEEFSGLWDELELEPRLLTRLARALETRGSDEAAAWCRQRLSEL